MGIGSSCSCRESACGGAPVSLAIAVVHVLSSRLSSASSLEPCRYSGHFRDVNLPAGAVNNNIYPFQRKMIDFFRSRDGAATDMMTSNLFLGECRARLGCPLPCLALLCFHLAGTNTPPRVPNKQAAPCPSPSLDCAGYSDGDATNFSSFTDPITVDWSSGAPVPALAPENLNFKVGGPVNFAGDVFRSLGGQVHGIATYREAHDTNTRLAITNWMDWGESNQTLALKKTGTCTSMACVRRWSCTSWSA